MTTLTDIAADIRRVSPGALPERIEVIPHSKRLWIRFGGVDRLSASLPPDIAESTLIAAMVMDGNIYRCSPQSYVGWCVRVTIATPHDRLFMDSAHGGSLWACHAAWRWAKGIDQLR